MVEFICGAILGSTITVSVMGLYLVPTCNNLRQENAKLRIELMHKR